MIFFKSREIKALKNEIESLKLKVSSLQDTQQQLLTHLELHLEYEYAHKGKYILKRGLEEKSKNWEGD
jgi:hypothetical protein